MTRTERAHVWQQHITGWQASGVSGSAYCKQQSLVYHQFVYWRRKLTSTEDYLKQEQAATGFTRVVSAPGAGIGSAEARGGTLEPVMSAHLVKMPKTVAALSLIFELSETGETSISDKSLAMALELADYLRSHLERL